MKRVSKFSSWADAFGTAGASPSRQNLRQKIIDQFRETPDQGNSDGSRNITVNGFTLHVKVIESDRFKTRVAIAGESLNTLTQCYDQEKLIFAAGGPAGFADKATAQAKEKASTLQR